MPAFAGCLQSSLPLSWFLLFFPLFLWFPAVAALWVAKCPLWLQQSLYLSNQLSASKCSELYSQEDSVYWLNFVSGRILAGNRWCTQQGNQRELNQETVYIKCGGQRVLAGPVDNPWGLILPGPGRVLGRSRISRTGGEPQAWKRGPPGRALAIHTRTQELPKSYSAEERRDEEGK